MSLRRLAVIVLSAAGALLAAVTGAASRPSLRSFSDGRSRSTARSSSVLPSISLVAERVRLGKKTLEVAAAKAK